MSPAEILSLYDEKMRRDPVVGPALRVEKAQQVTRILIDVLGAECGAILYSALDAGSADATVMSLFLFFRGNLEFLAGALHFPWTRYDAVNGDPYSL